MPRCEILSRRRGYRDAVALRLYYLIFNITTRDIVATRLSFTTCKRLCQI